MNLPEGLEIAMLRPHGGKVKIAFAGEAPVIEHYLADFNVIQCGGDSKIQGIS